MLVTVNAALDHFLQKRMSPTACAYMAAKYHTVGKRAVEITASLISFAKYFRSRRYQNLQNVCAPHQTDVCEMQ